VTTALILGSGPASAGVALALSRASDVKITILDIGLKLEPDKQGFVRVLSSTDPSEWDEQAIRSVSARPVRSTSDGLPEKRSYGSDFPFRDIGQLEGMSASKGSTSSLISAAYGGFSTVWGSQIMPFTAATFDSWPVSRSEIEPHYQAILKQIPFAAEQDDLAQMFPLMGSPIALPEVSARTSRVLAAYGRHRRRLNAMGVTMGRARLAFEAADCVRCGLCMTGCPYSLIYSASQTIDLLRLTHGVAYHSGLLALRLVEEADRAVVVAKELATGQIHRFEADRIFVACGAVGTTRVVANSLDLFELDIGMGESQQFTIPMLSRRAVPDPRNAEQFTLNQFNMVVTLDDLGFDVSQLHFYTYDPAFIDAMPAPLRSRMAEPLMLQVLRRLTVALGYLPSWHSPRLRLRLQRAPSEDMLPALQVAREDPRSSRNRMLREVLVKVVRSGPFLDLYPFLPKMLFAAGGKSYHWGGSFPHARDARTILGSDRLGRVGAWQRIHLVDAAVFPNVPATTFTLTIMANAHRIATEAMTLPR
jgi:ferredoxin